ncbi:hypothetical protein TNCT_542351 [Trichonephila clavata]|uniref:Uncharacterized protein n=1 Tax=Trichonephila clavata TaxID=2740835 RepID=A0A8X6HDF0_TRICU|nr:hypothetical protein TNCT_542351 [Trichonephila clavata]
MMPRPPTPTEQVIWFDKSSFTIISDRQTCVHRVNISRKLSGSYREGGSVLVGEAIPWRGLGLLEVLLGKMKGDHDRSIPTHNLHPTLHTQFTGSMSTSLVLMVIDSWLAFHGFETISNEEPPCRGVTAR